MTYGNARKNYKKTVCSVFTNYFLWNLVTRKSCSKKHDAHQCLTSTTSQKDFLKKQKEDEANAEMS
jgi:hypothetical protein